MIFKMNASGWLLSLTLSIVLAFPLPAFSREKQSLDETLETARRERLHEERTWQVLLHYAAMPWGGFKSRVDDPNFFLAPDGRTDPEAELTATIRNFFVNGARDDEHAACRFPARFNWLAARLSIDRSELPVFTCTERDKNLGAVEAKSAVLVFPVGHVNSPASMFGHTLIRIDGISRSNLISHAVNYAATATDTNGFLYAWKGLTGLYKGYYSMMPYYIKVKEYNDLEHRDMWEYRLKLSPDEVATMLNHIWELHNISSSYYFLDENCSYNLLFLIESARPTLHLTDQTGLFVLPTHTIRIASEAGMLEEPRFRPSQGARIRKIMSLLDQSHQKLAIELAHGTVTPAEAGLESLRPDDRVKVLDLAIELVQLRFVRKEMEKDAYNRLYLSLLGPRSRLGPVSDSMYGIQEPARPESGHDTTRIAVGGGIRRSKIFAELEVQPEFHSLLDPDQGYLRGAQIKFLSTRLRFNDSQPVATLQSLHVVDIFSVSPRDRYFKPFSWKVNIGLDHETLRNGLDYPLFRLNTGGGFAYSTYFGGLWYGLAELDINAGQKIRGIFTAGPGISVGIIEPINEWWKIHLDAQAFMYQVGDDRTAVKLSAAQNFRVSRNNSLTVGYIREYVNSHMLEEISGKWNHYF